MKMDLTPLLVAFSFIFLNELGDKTQLAVITLCARNDWKSVLGGAMLAFALVDGLSVLIGKGFSEVIPALFIQTAGGIIFIVFGLYLLLHKESENENLKLVGDSSGFVSALFFVSLAEFGDKTQLAVIILAANYAEPFLVFLGVMLAFSTITVIGILVGRGLTRVVPKKYWRLVSALLFIGSGVIFLLQSTIFT